MEFNFNYWIHHFNRSENRHRELNWKDGYRLSEDEKNLVSPMLAQFQKGERSEGAIFRNKADRFLRKTEDKSYLEALSLFVTEEQGHAELLTRFMEREDIPPIHSHTNDHLFKLVRRMGGLRWTVTVLLAVEVLSMPCFRALQHVTRSRLLRQISAEHLVDESSHLRFQAVALAKLLRVKGPLFRQVWRAGQFCLQRIVSGQAWRSYRPVLKAAGFTRRSFQKASERELARCLNFAGHESRTLEFNFQQTEVLLANAKS